MFHLLAAQTTTNIQEAMEVVGLQRECSHHHHTITTTAHHIMALVVSLIDPVLVEYLQLRITIRVKESPVCHPPNTNIKRIRSESPHHTG